MENCSKPAPAVAAEAVADTEVADMGRITLGAGFRLPPARPASAVADTGRVSLGAGFRLLSA